MDEWEEVFAGAGTDVRADVHALVQSLAPAFAATFYGEMFADEEASRLLDHRIVNDRLNRSMAGWLGSLFDPATPLVRLHELQRTTGEVHARVGVPMRLVTRGARVLKRAICRQLEDSALPPARHAIAVRYVHEVIDLAIDLVNAAYSQGFSRLLRTEESYRQFFLGQNLRAERERQRSQLLEWAHQILVRCFWEDGGSPNDAFGHSQFGLWLQHKASLMFEGAPEVELILAQVAAIERELQPQLRAARASQSDARRVVALINAGIEDIKRLLASMFDRVSGPEDSQDGVTHLLHRRYVPSVTRREIALCQRGQPPFAMLMLDIDHFRRLASTVGHEGGDQVLAQVAELLLDSVRAGDFVFRIGDDQFLVLAVEVTAEGALAMAEALRERIAGQALRTPGAARTQVTASIGIAVFDGHPDYQRLLDRAEAALRRAKSEGRDRCVADSSA